MISVANRPPLRRSLESVTRDIVSSWPQLHRTSGQRCWPRVATMILARLEYLQETCVCVCTGHVSTHVCFGGVCFWPPLTNPSELCTVGELLTSASIRCAMSRTRYARWHVDFSYFSFISAQIFKVSCVDSNKI